jgi:hypothetical protein
VHLSLTGAYNLFTSVRDSRGGPVCYLRGKINVYYKYKYNISTVSLVNVRVAGTFSQKVVNM